MEYAASIMKSFTSGSVGKIKPHYHWKTANSSVISLAKYLGAEAVFNSEEADVVVVHHSRVRTKRYDYELFRILDRGRETSRNES